MMTSGKFYRIAIVGVGLIGSSICRVLKERHLCSEVVGCDRLKSTRDKAKKLRLVDDIFAKPEDAVKNADLVVLCIPVGAYKKVVTAIAPALKRNAIVTDTGSVKASVVQTVVPLLPDSVVFVPGHPVAGTEHSGPEAGFASIFDGNWCLLTPVAGTPKGSVARVAEFWRACGARVDFMSPEHHDLALAVTSHLPHMIAFRIVGMAANLEIVSRKEVMKFSAGGFGDFTRIASSNSDMWTDIFMQNKETILDVLGHFNESLAELSRAVRIGDKKQIKQCIDTAKIIRSNIEKNGTVRNDD
jgi:cyclohexadieny/prephenate dehydrogenase